MLCRGRQLGGSCCCWMVRGAARGWAQPYSCSISAKKGTFSADLDAGDTFQSGATQLSPLFPLPTAEPAWRGPAPPWVRARLKAQKCVFF